MLDILAITGPIYFAIALGYATTRWGLFDKADMRVFGKFVINLALPGLLFNSLSQRRIGDILNGTYLAAYLGGSLLVVGLGWLWCRRSARLSPIDSVVHVMGVSCSNSGFVGYPILLLTTALAPVAGVALALNMLVENIIIIPLMLALGERAEGHGGPWWRIVGNALARLARNPMIIGLAAGVLASAIGWTPPGPVARTINLFATASGGLSLFVIGGTLVGLPFRGMGKRVLPVALAKLLIHPLCVLAMLGVLGALGLSQLDADLRTAAVVLAAMPMMSIYPILAQAWKQEEFAASALLLTTVVSFFTLSGLLWALQHLPH